MVKTPPKIISMVGRDLAGYHSNLHDGFGQLGIENHFFFERTHAFYRHKKKRSHLEKMITLLNDFIVRPQHHKIIKIISFAALYPAVYLMKVVLFVSFIRQYDVFIFGASYSFLGFYIDRIFLKAAGKIIIDPVSGSDVRPPYLNGVYVDASIKQIYKKTLSKYKTIIRKLKYTTYLIDHPTVSQFHTKEYIPHLYVGFPFYLPPQPRIPTHERPLILHAPSNPKVKGTDIVRAAVSELQKDYDFDYEELVGVSHDKVMEKLQQSTFIVNELYSDTPMSGLDTEAAWFGKPSIVGGYNLDMVTETIVGYEVPPSYLIQPTKDDLKKAMIHLLTDASYCKKLGQEAQDFVKKNWSSKAVAQKYLDIINGDVPRHIMRSPMDDYDIYGCGIRNDARRDIIKALVTQYGEQSLCLGHKQQLQKRILDDCYVRSGGGI